VRQARNGTYRLDWNRPGRRRTTLCWAERPVRVVVTMVVEVVVVVVVVVVFSAVLSRRKMATGSDKEIERERVCVLVSGWQTAPNSSGACNLIAAGIRFRI